MTELTSAGSLTATSLYGLVTGDVEVLCHEGFYPASACRQALPNVVRACEVAQYTLTSDFQSLGTSIGEAAESQEHLSRYLDTAAATTSMIRNEIFAGQLCPLDQIRLMLDELWPHGASVARFDGRLMLPGIIRRWPSGAHANPHIDQREIPLLSQYKLTRRIGVNIYLEVPPAGAGGEIDFWGTFEDEESYLAQKRADYGLDREALGAPHWSKRPGQGDLIMFDAARVHGVRRVTSGSRVAAACFVGVRTVDDPLVVFA